MQVGLLQDGLLPIPEEAQTILLEIGASDRNTMDEEMLPRLPKETFLISAEPLIDKYARALGRRAPAYSVKDSLEPLGQHHERGIVLPIAVSPIAAGTEAYVAEGSSADAAALSDAINALDRVSSPKLAAAVAEAKRSLQAAFRGSGEDLLGGGGGGHSRRRRGRFAATSGVGELRTFNIGGNAGCSSLLTPNRSRHKGGKYRTMVASVSR